MNIGITPAPIEDTPVVRNMVELYRYYRHDFSEFYGRDLSEHGLYDYGRLDHYWTDDNRYPFLVRVSEQLAGFALVSTFQRDEHRETRFSEFFNLCKYHRQGVGEAVAHDLFARFPGPWVLVEHEHNVAAQRFWRTGIGRYTGEAFAEHVDSDTGRVVQEFVVPGIPPSLIRQRRQAHREENRDDQ